MTPYVSRCRRIWMIACPWVLLLQDLVMRRTRRARKPNMLAFLLGAGSGNNPSQGIPGPFSLGFDFRSWWSPVFCGAGREVD